MAAVDCSGSSWKAAVSSTPIGPQVGACGGAGSARAGGLGTSRSGVRRIAGSAGGRDHRHGGRDAAAPTPSWEDLDHGP
jgi:hypothetical protein